MDPIVITSARLRVEIDHPDLPRRVPRFSRAGYVRQVVLDGRHSFCGVEGQAANGFTTDGAGLCQEFGIEGPCGFDDCPPGGDFPKPGTGLLLRPDLRRYHRGHPYACTPFPVEVLAKDARARFAVEPLPCRGLAMRLVQDLEVENEHLVVNCQAMNLGNRPFVLEEYRHDFLAPGGRGAAPGHLLAFDRPMAVRWPDRAQGLASDGRTLAVWPERPGVPRAVDLEPDGPTSWSFRDPATGLGVRHTTDQPWTRFNCWVGPAVFSPEVFITMCCPVDGSVSWRRTYTFSGPD